MWTYTGFTSMHMSPCSVISGSLKAMDYPGTSSTTSIGILVSIIFFKKRNQRPLEK